MVGGVEVENRETVIEVRSVGPEGRKGNETLRTKLESRNRE